jgi:hypothetical protein
VAARDPADAVGHGDDGKAEGEGDTEHADRGRPDGRTCDDGGAAAEQDEREGPDELSEHLVQGVSSRHNQRWGVLYY